MTIRLVEIPTGRHFILLSSILSLVFSNASEMSICARDILKNGSSIQYCVGPNLTTRSWYRAMAECRFYGGELVTLERPEKIKDIQEQLSEYNINISTGLFVNAHKPFYSGNNQFAWNTGETLDLVGDSKLMEECVYFSNYLLGTISCSQDESSILLLCQRTSRKMYISPDLKILKLAGDVSREQIEYQFQTCEYYTFISSDFNWYQSKIFCETKNSELMGMPNKKMSIN